MAKPRRKNISREIRDIRFPTSHVPPKPAVTEQPVRKIWPVSAARNQEPILPERPLRKRRLAVLVCVILLVVIAGGVLWYKDKIAQAFRLREAIVQVFHIDGAIEAPANPISSSASSLGDWMAIIKNTFSSYGDIQEASWQALGALGQAESVLQDLPVMLLQKNGPGLVADLGDLRDILKAINTALQGIDNINSDGSPILPDLSDYLAYQPDIERAESAVGALVALLQAPGQHHLLVLFGNSAELRPGGGFLGSFADISFGSSTIGDITVHDINEVDRGFAPNIVPPKPLQGLVTYWLPADANWFFDYPTSAAKTLELMAQSSFYASSTGPNILDGAILISPKVIQDLLKATGPLTLADGTTTITADTVMPMIQREVQAGQASGAPDPKKILAELLSPLETKLQNLEPAAQDQLLAAAKDWIANRDVEVFMKNTELAKTLAYYHADGGSYVLPQNFSGDYFAAVNANVGGGKSDALISDIINIESDLRADGVIHDQVSVTRADSAAKSDEWWYKVTNQDYLQIFTPQGTTLTAASGGKTRTITPRTSYAHGFTTDPDIVAMESTLAPIPGIATVSKFQESGKNVFATWLTTPAGKTSTASFEYSRRLNEPFRDAATYTFVFERQSGADQALDITLNAPPGFVWQTSGLSQYEYINPSAPGRVMLELKLKAL